jgi:hypothetical protein
MKTRRSRSLRFPGEYPREVVSIEGGGIVPEAFYIGLCDYRVDGYRESKYA